MAQDIIAFPRPTLLLEIHAHAGTDTELCLGNRIPMFGTLLDKLVSVFSKNLVIGSMPLFAFLYLNSLMTYRISYHFQRWIQRNYFSQNPARQALISFALLLLIVIVSYVL